MAATPFETFPNGPFLFDIYTDDGTPAARPAPVLQLPAGPCNFVDLTPGANGAKCGCRRFWGRPASGVAPLAAGLGPDQQLYCMCSHHACFHDDAGSAQFGPPLPMDMAAGQENEKPRTSREPLSPVQDLTSFHIPAGLEPTPAADLAALNFTALSPDRGPPPTLPAPVQRMAAAAAAAASSMPDTLSWNHNGPSQAGLAGLPPIPSQCLLPSQSASTNASSQMRYLRPFAGKGLETLSSVPSGQPIGPSKDKAAETAMARHGGGGGDGHGGDDDRSRPSLEATAVGGGAATPKALTTQELLDRLAPSSTPPGPGHQALQQLSDVVSGHEQRLDRLEGASFSVVGHEDCNDKHEHIDLRVTELESRVEEVEKRLTADDNSSLTTSRRVTRRDDDAANSVVSASASTMAHAQDRTDLNSQLQALQAQVNHLQALSLPSYNRPWELEVVFLPFPLKGIWLKLEDFPPTLKQAGKRPALDDWTQMPNTHSRATPDLQSPLANDWAGNDPDWLLPRACAPGRVIDQRLRSRGLVKTVAVRGFDARSVHLAVGEAFDAVLGAMPSAPGPLTQRLPYASDSRVAKFLGLQQPWIPLRKLHKDSRLRFLSPAELLTPVLWDVGFLMSSVVMKATGMQRLYVTQPEAYLQDLHVPGYRSTGWTWQKLRELSRVYPDSQSSAASADVPEADAMEECWAWNDRLDELPSVQVRGAKQDQARQLHISRSSGGSPRQLFIGAQSPLLPASQRADGDHVQPAPKERTGSRPPRLRTASMPPAPAPAPAPATNSPSGDGKRRVASITAADARASAYAAYERRSSPFPSGRPSPRVPLASASLAIISKQRRRSTRSPSLRPRNTPRWSNRSFSRSPSLVPGAGAWGFFEDDRGERRTTPFCYATPYSNAPPDHPPQAQYVVGDNKATDDDAGGTMAFLERDGYLYDDDDNSEPGSHDAQPAGGDKDLGASNDIDIDVYEDEADELDEMDTDAGNPDLRDYERYPVQSSGPAQDVPQLPEDEPWPGIEDNMSDGENMDPQDLSADGSDTSSQPSEYPSTQRAWHMVDDHGMHEPNSSRPGFKIHEDESEVAGPESLRQWQ